MRLRFARATQSCLVACFVATLLLAGCGTQPTPLTDVEVKQRALKDRAMLRAEAVPPAGPLTFGKAVVHALENNLEIRLAAMDTVLKQGVVDLADFQMLPRVMLNAGYNWRNPTGGSTSDTTPLDPVRRTNSAELSWNILDFGISYIRSKQEANNQLVSEERRRRTTNSIINEVRLAYWQSYLGGQRLPQIRAVANDIEQAMARSRQLVEAQLQDPLIALTYQEGLLELKRQLKTYEADVAQSRARLSRLLNLPPGPPPALAASTSGDESIQALGAFATETLEDVALSTRTELREQDYAMRNLRLDVITAYQQMLPSLNLRVARLFDSTNTLRTNRWLEQEGSASWNILGIWSAFERGKFANLGIASGELKRLALSLAVMEQTAVAHEQLRVLDEDYRLAHDITTVRQQIWETRRDRLPFGESDELERSRAAVALVAAQIRADRAYASLQKAYGDLLASLGVDQVPDGFDLGATDIAAQVDRHFAQLPQRIRDLATAGGAPAANTATEKGD